MKILNVEKTTPDFSDPQVSEAMTRIYDDYAQLYGKRIADVYGTSANKHVVEQSFLLEMPMSSVSAGQDLELVAYVEDVDQSIGRDNVALKIRYRCNSTGSIHHKRIEY